MPRPIPRPAPRPVAKTGSVNISTALAHKQDVLQEKTRDVAEASPTTSNDPTAKVSVGVGQTINTGDYNSLRIDVRVELPCSPDEVEVTYNTASDLAAGYLMNERKIWLGE